MMRKYLFYVFLCLCLPAASFAAWGNNPDIATGSNTTSVTITAYAVPAGDNKILLCGTGTEEGTATSIAVSSITHNAVGLTHVAGADGEITDSSTYTNRTELWYLLLGSGAPTGDIVVTMAAVTDRIALICHTGTGLAQQGPEAVNNGNTVANSITTSVTSITANAELADMVTEHQSETVAESGAGQTEIQEGSSGAHTSAMSGITATSAGSYDFVWCSTACAAARRWAHSTSAWEVAAAGFSGRLPVHIMMGP